jgi:hypothetical protein
VRGCWRRFDGLAYCRHCSASPEQQGAPKATDRMHNIEGGLITRDVLQQTIDCLCRVASGHSACKPPPVVAKSQPSFSRRNLRYRNIDISLVTVAMVPDLHVGARVCSHARFLDAVVSIYELEDVHVQAQTFIIQYFPTMRCRRRGRVSSRSIRPRVVLHTGYE